MPGWYQRQIIVTNVFGGLSQSLNSNAKINTFKYVNKNFSQIRQCPGPELKWDYQNTSIELNAMLIFFINQRVATNGRKRKILE
jgi:hypothetical protein